MTSDLIQTPRSLLQFLVAVTNTTYHDDDSNEWICVACGGHSSRWHEIVHDQVCPVHAARTLLEGEV